MRIAILGATSQIAKDLVLSFCPQSTHELVLYARRPGVVKQWLASVGLSNRFAVADFGAFGADEHFNAIINFVGVGNPAQAAAMGASIFDVTFRYDQLALDYLQAHPSCRYMFLSSGAAYGTCFDAPVDQNTSAVIPINRIQPQDWYGVAKLHAECRHRAQSQLPIIDIRVFNYFSRSQDMTARFLITDILRAIRNDAVLKTSPDHIVRDFLHPSDFCQMINALLNSPATNATLDCYSRAPVDKAALLAFMQENFGLRYETVNTPASVNATGSKLFYFSLNRRAEDFGYRPVLSSLECIAMESAETLKRSRP